MGIGRFGSFAGPLVIGLLVERGWQIANSFIALGAAAVSAAVFTGLITSGRGSSSDGSLSISRR
jgi:AAHS family 4-hydroxybenzoate transporter-like MFS transporter